MMGISVSRFIDRLELCFGRNDMEGARECLRFWEGEARRLGDERGLLTVLNEEIGYYRRVRNKTQALEAVRESLELVDRLLQAQSPSGANVLINAATTLSSFQREEEALELYGRAGECFEAAGRTNTYEYAALLNNRAAALKEVKRYDEAEADWEKAIRILKQVGYHAGEIAISLIMLAHLTFERDNTAFERVEALLDEAWEYINSQDQPKDSSYAYVLQKCAPSLEYFQRPMEAEACREVADEIYSRE